jgi:3-hydroxyisobutyrate dehydrogenase-like beta-hydroxyacid dehydrogenase
MVEVAVIAPGAMGAGVARRLGEHGVKVRTWLEGRSPASVARAAEAGMRAVDLAGIAEADIVLSIVPPAEAMKLAQRLAPVLAMAAKPPVYVDCNAVSPQTVLLIQAAMPGVRFVDAGIIGLPPKPGGPAPVLYAAGPHAALLSVLSDYGIPVTVLSGPIGAASGLKMSYAGINKGLTGLAAAMILAATRCGAAADLRTELAASQPQLLARFRSSLPGMLPKAYRWVAEMEEIGDFASEVPGVTEIYQGLAKLYAALAADADGAQLDAAALKAFVEGI